MLWTDRYRTQCARYMGRPREFEDQAVVTEALQMFWKQGYRATSIPDLLKATRLERGSLYKAFKDKRSLFDRAFNTYLRSGRSAMIETLSGAGSPRERIAAWLSQVAQGCSGAIGGPGWLAANAMVELAPVEAAVRVRLQRHWDIVEATLGKPWPKGSGPAKSVAMSLRASSRR